MAKDNDLGKTNIDTVKGISFAIGFLLISGSAVIILPFLVGFDRYLFSVLLIFIYNLFLLSEQYEFNIFTVFYSFVFFFLVINTAFFDSLSMLLNRSFLMDSVPKANIVLIVALSFLLVGDFIGKRLLRNPQKSLIKFFWISERFTAKTNNIIRSIGFLGIILVFSSMFLMGIFPIFAANPVAAKYFADEYHASYESYLYLFRLGMIFANTCAPFLLMELFREKKDPRAVTINLILMTMLVALSVVTMRRGIMLGPVIIFCLLSIFLLRKNVLKKIFKLLLITTASLMLLISFNVYFYNMGAFSIAGNVISNISDYQDYVYTLYLFEGDDYLLGRTYLANLVPLPPSLSDLRDSYTTANVTKRLMGLGSQSPHGGLRIFYFGEAFLNFGLVGVSILSLLLGLYWGILSNTAKFLKENRASLESATFFCAIFSATVFGFYQSGFNMDLMVGIIMSYLIVKVLPRLVIRAG